MRRGTIIVAAVFLFSAFSAAAEELVYVSDIDDTIIQSNVANKVALVKAALSRKPRNAFEGMSLLYHNLLAENPHAELVYLSSTPEMMRNGMSRLLEKNRFPKARMILRKWYPILSDLTFGLIGDTIFSSKRYKTRALRKLFRENPDKKFVLIGDDVEYDKEVYRKMAREFPGQVKEIYIRRVIGREPLGAGAPGVKEFSTEWHIAHSEYAAGRLSADGVIEIGTALLERTRTQPLLVYPRFIRSFIGFSDDAVRTEDISFLTRLKALAYDLNKAFGLLPYCERLLLGGEPPREPPAPPSGS